MVAEGRLHLSAISLLAPHLTPANAAELMAEATHKSKAEVELIIARRFPRSDVPECERPLGSSTANSSPTAQVVANIAAQLSPVTVVPTNSEDSPVSTEPLLAPLDEASAVQKVFTQALGEAAAKCGAESLSQPVLSALAGSLAEVVVNAAAAVAPEATAQAEVPARVTPRSAGRFAWQLTADQDMQDLLEEARRLIGFSGSRELAHVLKRGLELLVQALRKQKCAATSKPMSAREPNTTANGRHVPRAVAREVIARDGGQCTFVAPDGRRCSARTNLQLDHVIPLARGGRTTTDNLRQLCGPHNQHEAERVFGKPHMQAQREARRARTERSQRARAAGRVSKAKRATREPAGPSNEPRATQSPRAASAAMRHHPPPEPALRLSRPTEGATGAARIRRSPARSGRPSGGEAPPRRPRSEPPRTQATVRGSIR